MIFLSCINFSHLHNFNFFLFLQHDKENVSDYTLIEEHYKGIYIDLQGYVVNYENQPYKGFLFAYVPFLKKYLIFFFAFCPF